MMHLAQPSIAQQYAIAFRNWDRDLDVDRGSEESVVARFQDQPEPVVQEVVAGLDRWMHKQHKESTRGPVAEAVSDRRPPGPRQPEPAVAGVVDRGGMPDARRVAGLLGAWPPWPALWELGPGKDWRRLQELGGRVHPETESVLTVLLLAEASGAVGDAAGAEQVLRRGLAARPDQVVLLNALGKLLEREGRSRLGEAIECYRAARAVRPQLGIALAEALRKLGKAAEGEAILQTWLADSRTTPRRMPPSAMHCKAQNKLVDAEIAYRKAIELQPNSAAAYHNLGTVPIEFPRRSMPTRLRRSARPSPFSPIWPRRTFTSV